MKVRIFPASPGEASHEQHLSTYAVDDVAAIDAGCLGLHSRSPDAVGIRHVFLTHAHIDHIGTLPIFIEGRTTPEAPPVRVFGPSETLEALREHVFNGQVWVKFEALSRGEHPAIEFTPVRPEETVIVSHLRVTPVPVAHTVPTYGYIVDDGSCAVAFGADSGPTGRIWELAAATGRLRAAFLECSFPDALEELAVKTCHLTPRLWAREAAKLPPDIEVIAVHIKPGHRERTVGELLALAGGRFRIGRPGREYIL
jgi:ribonuclease BN (tRNA processing enzyme)